MPARRGDICAKLRRLVDYRHERERGLPDPDLGGGVRLGVSFRAIRLAGVADSATGLSRTVRHRAEQGTAAGDSAGGGPGGRGGGDLRHRVPLFHLHRIINNHAAKHILTPVRGLNLYKSEG